LQEHFYRAPNSQHELLSGKSNYRQELKCNTNGIDLTQFPRPFLNSTPHNQFHVSSCHRFKVLDSDNEKTGFIP